MRVELLAYTRDADRICASAGNSCYSEHPSYEIMEDIDPERTLSRIVGMGHHNDTHIQGTVVCLRSHRRNLRFVSARICSCRGKEAQKELPFFPENGKKARNFAHACAECAQRFSLFPAYAGTGLSCPCLGISSLAPSRVQGGGVRWLWGILPGLWPCPLPRPQPRTCGARLYSRRPG